MRRDTDTDQHVRFYSVSTMPRRNWVALSAEQLPGDGQPALTDVTLYLTVPLARELAAMLLDAANALEKVTA